MGACGGKQAANDGDYDVNDGSAQVQRIEKKNPASSTATIDTTKLLQKGIEAKFNHDGDDVKEISKEALKKMDRY